MGTSLAVRWLTALRTISPNLHVPANVVYCKGCIYEYTDVRIEVWPGG